MRKHITASDKIVAKLLEKTALDELVYEGKDYESIYGIVRGHLNSGKFITAIERIKGDILREIRRELDIPSDAYVRRDHDGVSKLDYLIEKMMGEHLASGKIRF